MYGHTGCVGIAYPEAVEEVQALELVHRLLVELPTHTSHSTSRHGEKLATHLSAPFFLTPACCMLRFTPYALIHASIRVFLCPHIGSTHVMFVVVLGVGRLYVVCNIYIYVKYYYVCLCVVLGVGRLVEVEVPPEDLVRALARQHHLDPHSLDLARHEEHRRRGAHLGQAKQGEGGEGSAGGEGQGNKRTKEKTRQGETGVSGWKKGRGVGKGEGKRGWEGVRAYRGHVVRLQVADDLTDLSHPQKHGKEKVTHPACDKSGCTYVCVYICVGCCKKGHRTPAESPRVFCGFVCMFLCVCFCVAYRVEPLLDGVDVGVVHRAQELGHLHNHRHTK